MHCSETGLSGTLICCCNTASRGCFWEAYLGAQGNGKAYAIYFKTFTCVGAALEAPNTNYYNDVLHVHRHHRRSVSDAVNSRQLAIDLSVQHCPCLASLPPIFPTFMHYAPLFYHTPCPLPYPPPPPPPSLPPPPFSLFLSPFFSSPPPPL